VTTTVTLRSLGRRVYLPSFLFFLGDGAVVPIIALAARDLGASPALAGFMVALRALGVLAFDVPAAAIITRFGERAAIALGSSVVVLSLAGWLLTRSLAVFGALAFVQGSGWSVWQLARMAYMSETVPIGLRGRAMSTFGGVLRVGMFAGAFMGAALASLDGFRAVYLAAAALVLVAAAILLRTVPAGEGRAAEDDATAFGDVARAHAGVLLTAGFAASAIQALRQVRFAVLPLWADHIGLGPSTASIVVGVSAGVELLFVYPGGSLMDRFGRKAVAVPCLALVSAGVLLVPVTHGVTSLLLVGALMGVGNGLSAGVVMTLGADLSPAVGRAHFLGAWRLFADLGTAAGPLLVAGATAAFTLGGAATLTGAAGLLAASLVVKAVPETRRDERG
jgi:MFS family permease